MKTTSQNQSVSNTKVKTIILAGSRDYRRYPLSSRFPTVLWPVAGKPVLERLINSLSDQGIKYVTICSDGDSSSLKQSIKVENHLELTFLNEEFPLGTAGCIRDAVESNTKELLLVFPANIVNPPKIDDLIKAHNQRHSDLTIMFNPSREDDKAPGEPAGIYICQAGVLEHIPKEGYFDIKEGLIPKMLLVGKTVHAAVLPKHAGNFRNWQGYLWAISNYLENVSELNGDSRLNKQGDSQNVWVTANSKVEQSARIYGPTVLMNGAHISEGAVIFGPTIIGRNVHIGKDSIVINSVLWDKAQIGPNCTIQQSVVDYDATVPGNTIIKEELIPYKPANVLKHIAKNVLEAAKDNTRKLNDVLQIQLSKINKILPDSVQLEKTKIVPWAAAILIISAFFWSYWPNLKEIWNIWLRSDEYSSGLLVPFLAFYILLSRRHELSEYPVRPSLWGLATFVFAQALRLFGLFFMYNSAERLSIALSIASVVLLLCGWQLFRKICTVLLFLCLMLPWPNRIQTAVTLPMQRWATSSAVFCLETIGYEVVQEGNVIHISGATVAVAEACNGLRMVTAFFVISGLMVLLVERAWWEKLIILSSSLPIALLCNTIRLTITAIAFTMFPGEHWEKIFHDFGGYAMMPLALAIVVAELWLLTKLTALPTEEQAIIIARRNS
jgi:exosortase